MRTTENLERGHLDGPFFQPECCEVAISLRRKALLQSQSQLAFSFSNQEAALVLCPRLYDCKYQVIYFPSEMLRTDELKYSTDGCQRLMRCAIVISNILHFSMEYKYSRTKRGSIEHLEQRYCFWLLWFRSLS